VKRGTVGKKKIRRKRKRNLEDCSGRLRRKQQMGKGGKGKEHAGEGKSLEQ